MRGFGWAVGAAVAAIALSGAAPESPAATAKKCGKTGSVRNVTTTGDSCATAKRVARDWRRFCQSAGRCQIDLPNGDQYPCKARNSGGRVVVRCSGEGDVIKFDAPIP